jgi:alkylated DNA repair dioxygenase AlkB
MPDEPLVWQPSLLQATAVVGIDGDFASVVRHQLDGASWVDYAPQWLRGEESLFAELVAGRSWGQRTRRLFERQVLEPRLTSSWAAADGAPLAPPVLEQMRTVLSERYRVDFDSVGFNLYRDGRDSVAWHGDRIAREIREPVVALVSLGDARPFLLRPRGGGRSRRFLVRGGDLLVTGGRTQREWQHSVPKVASAGPRISLAFRHGLERPQAPEPPPAY